MIVNHKFMPQTWDNTQINVTRTNMRPWARKKNQIKLMTRMMTEKKIRITTQPLKNKVQMKEIMTMKCEHQAKPQLRGKARKKLR